MRVKMILVRIKIGVLIPKLFLILNDRDIVLII